MLIRNPKPFLTAAAAFLAAAIAACGGGSGGSAGNGGACSATNQKQFVLAAAREWYLFQDLLPQSVNPANYATAGELLDALTATARSQGKDRFFSFLTTPQADNSFFQEGQSIAFGFRTSIQGNRLFVPDVIEGSPAEAGGLTRGIEITAIDSGSGFVPIATILATDPNLEQAFGPADQGVQRGLRFLRLNGQQVEVTLTKQLITIPPLPTTNGTAILALPSNPAVEVGYVRLRTFITTAETPLRNAYAQFLAQGINNIIVDFRGNGGGLLSVADFIGDLNGRNRTAADVFSRMRFNTSKSSNDSVHRFVFQAQSIAPVRIAFITDAGTASASELVINGMKPWVEIAIVGADTYGKPVGQAAFDMAGCEVRLRLIAFKVTNAQDEGDYFDGLASTLAFACRATDDLSRIPGDPAEDSTAEALDWLGTGACSQIMSTGVPSLQLTLPPARQPMSRSPTPAQAWLPGLF